MSKKQKQSARAGTYALCITIGVIIGIGLAPVVDNLPVTLLAGTLAGAVAGWLINKQSRSRKHHGHHH